MIFIYLILLLISVVFYIMYVGAFSYYLMVFMIVLPIVLFLLDLYLSRKVKVYFTQKTQKAMGKTPLQLEIVAENTSAFPVANLEIVLEYHSAIETDGKNIAKINSPIMPKESHSMLLNIASLHVGAVDFKIKKCRIFDFLRLFKFKLRGNGYSECQKDSTVYVYPQYSHLENQISDYSNTGIDSDEYSPDKKGDDPSQIFDIHEYVEGDKPNRIHWKLTAKQDSVMVKDYSLPMTFALNIFINLNTDSLRSYDAIIQSALSVSMLLTERGYAHSISWYDAGEQNLVHMNIKDEQEHIDCSEALIKTKTYRNETLPIYPFTAEEGQVNCAHMIVVTQALDSSEINSISESGCASRYTFVFAVNDQQLLGQVDVNDNVTVLNVMRDRVAEAFSDILL